MNDPVEHVEDQLTWYVNGSLEEPEIQAVETHLSYCQQCQAELDWLRAVRMETKANASEFTPEPGLRRLMEKIRADKKSAKTAWRFWPRFEASWLSPAMGFATALIFLQAVVIGGLVTREGPDQQMLSTQPTEAQGARLQVTFRPDSREGDLRPMLVSLHAEIVSGPGVLGVYTLQVPKADAELAVQQLQRRPDLVQSVHLLAGAK